MHDRIISALLDSPSYVNETVFTSYMNQGKTGYQRLNFKDNRITGKTEIASIVTYFYEMRTVNISIELKIVLNSCG